MLHPGDSISDPLAGVRIVFRSTAAQTGGCALVFEAFLEPTGHVPRDHVHPRQEQRLEVLSGSLGSAIGGRRSVARAGTRLAIPRGTPHRIWNAGDDLAHVVVEIAPALHYESLVESLFALAVETHAAGRSRPGLLRRLAVLEAHFGTAHAAFPPAPVQRLLLAVAASVARMLGHRPVHPASEPDATGSTP
jgi:quercetin dioxygenase-like cupin family protein